MVAQAVERLELPGPPDDSFRPDPATVQLFYEGWSVEVRAVEGTALIERPRGRLEPARTRGEVGAFSMVSISIRSMSSSSSS